MMVTRGYFRLPTFIAIGWVLMTSVACAPIEKRIERAAGGPKVPADSSVLMRAADAGRPEAVEAPVSTPGPLNLTVTEAILLCLENNRALLVQRLNPSIRQTVEDEERAVFDPAINADISAGKVKGERLARSGSETEAFLIDTAEGTISLSQYFPTGTTVALEAGTQMSDSSLYNDTFYPTRLGMTVTQALLKGFGADVNLVRLQQAVIDTRMSEYELRGFTEALVAEMERTYWDYALARRQIEIVEQSLKVARQQLDETETLITVGRLAKSELAAVRAEVAAQEQALIEVRANKETIRLHLLRLLNPAGPGLWQREVELTHPPVLPEITLEDVSLHVAVSMRMQPLLNEARLEIVRGDLALVETRDGLLPAMDFFITLGKSGYANSFKDSIGNIDEDSYDALAGVRFNFPFFNREAKSLHQRALLTREQAQQSLENLAQLVELDVRTAYIEVNRTRQQIAASSVTRMFDEEKLRIETEKLRVGKSTSFMVAQAQRDLLVSRIAEVRALTNYLKTLIDLYRQDGSLLERRGISAPGREPVTFSIP
ncbi:MAG: TolC family protein [Desulfobacterales bacterium]|jgi:outer membrane protein TolC|nr:TolC family protein [Desulfobacterales bacterium]